MLFTLARRGCCLAALQVVVDENRNAAPRKTNCEYYEPIHTTTPRLGAGCASPGAEIACGMIDTSPRPERALVKLYLVPFGLANGGTVPNNGRRFRAMMRQMVQNDRPNALDNPEWVTRTLLFADVVESVRLMEENESGVVQRWRRFVALAEREV